jgi:hypothetical protein
MSTIDQLTVASLTAAVNEMKSPNQFLRRLVFSNHETKPTGTIEIDVLTKARETAPFVGYGAEGVMVAGHGETFQSVTAPSIRIKRPFTPSELLEGRRPGGTIFQDSSASLNAMIDMHVARDMQVLADLETNSEEYLISLAIQGAISYQVADQANFLITFPKPAGNTVILATFWDDPDSSLPTMEQDFLTAKRLISNAVGLVPTHCILGQAASGAFLTLLKKQFIGYGLQMPGFGVGNVDLQSQFNEDGAIFHGWFSGIQVWEYSRTVSVNGVSTALVRSKYAEFLCVTPAAENVLYYGAIPDMKALGAGMFQQAERFSKSWITEDPSLMWALLHGRPLPVPRRPGSMVSMKVVSGV